MILEMCNNFTLLTSFLFFTNLIINKLSLDTFFIRTYSWLVIGLGTGLLGVLLMTLTITIDNHAVLDLRQLAIMISVYLGGGVSGIICTLVIAVYRLFFINGIHSASILGASNAVVTLLITLAAFRGKHVNFAKKWTRGVIGTFLAQITAYFILMGNHDLLPQLKFTCIYLIGGILTYQVINYLRKSNDLFHMMKEAANKDFLTGLHNSRAFDAIFHHEALAQKESPSTCSLLLVDIDHFKKINDTYGHVNGDAVLTQLGQVFRSSISSDHICFRKGGEEFAVLLSNYGLDGAAIIGERIRKHVEHFPFELTSGDTIQLTVSIGIGVFPEIPLEQLIDKADEALYQAKASGRNQVCIAHLDHTTLP